jgi:hypothetical protein
MSNDPKTPKKEPMISSENRPTAIDFEAPVSQLKVRELLALVPWAEYFKVEKEITKELHKVEKEAIKPETHKPAPTFLEANKAETVKPETFKPEIHKPEIHKPEIFKPEITKPEISKPEFSKPEFSKVEKEVIKEGFKPEKEIFKELLKPEGLKGEKELKPEGDPIEQIADRVIQKLREQNVIK